MMVPTEEGQCICFLCSQLFKDSYDEKSDTWMFKGAVYINNLSSESGIQSTIVHKNCISESSQNLRRMEDIKLIRGSVLDGNHKCSLTYLMYKIIGDDSSLDSTRGNWSDLVCGIFIVIFLSLIVLVNKMRIIVMFVTPHFYGEKSFFN